MTTTDSGNAARTTWEPGRPYARPQVLTTSVRSATGSIPSTPSTGRGWFFSQHLSRHSGIVGIDTPAGQYTYHYEAKDWDRFDCEALETGKHWDGHTDADVERLMSLEVPTKEVKTKKAKKNGNR